MFAIRRLRRFFADQRGGVSVMLVLMMIPMIGVMGMAVEGASFYFTGRAMQNAADSAALAAATNTCAAGDTCHTSGATQPTFVQEAAAVATNYGFTDSINDTTVSTKTKACPADPTATCYWVKITRVVPVNMLRIIGFRGDAALSNGLGRGQTIAALSVASPKSLPSTLCLWALNWNNAAAGIVTKGASSPLPFTGCSIGTNGPADCNQPQGALSTLATNSSSQCGGPVKNFHVTDPYAALASKIPVKSPACDPKAKITPLSGGNIALSPTAPVFFCSGLSISGNVTTSGTGAIVLVNGPLLLNGNTFQSGVNSGVTLIFTGTGTTSSAIEENGKGVLDIAAPQSGDWSGIAIYTDPNQTGQTVYTQNGANAVSWQITGLVYMPHSDMTLNGDVTHATNATAGAQDCFALVSDIFRSNGGVRFLEHQTQCASAGLIPPQGGTAIRQALVQ